MFQSQFKKLYAKSIYSSNKIDEIKASIFKIIPNLEMIDSAEKLVDYGRDESDLGCYIPDIVVKPKNTQEVSQILKLANSKNICIVPRGAGSGRVGGALPIFGGIVISLEYFNHISEINSRSFYGIVEPGVITDIFAKMAEQQGLLYPPDPASIEYCSIGGNVACNAGGPRAFKYGVTRNYVLGLQCVLPDGEIVSVGTKTIKGVAGYDLTSLLVGSEGTLGILTSITLRLLAKPISRKTFLAFFSNGKDAQNFIISVIQKGIIPATMEWLDHTCLMVFAKAMNRHLYHHETSPKVALLIELDEYISSQDMSAVIIEMIHSLGTDHHALELLFIDNQAESSHIWNVRRQMSRLLRQLKENKYSEDIVVPIDRLNDFQNGAYELSNTYGILVANFGHAGDGNFHLNILFDESEREKAMNVAKELYQLVISLEGTIAGEHGISLLKRDILSMEQSEKVIALQKNIKHVFDPKNILNPGKSLPGTDIHTHHE